MINVILLMLAYVMLYFKMSEAALSNTNQHTFGVITHRFLNVGLWMYMFMYIEYWNVPSHHISRLAGI